MGSTFPEKRIVIVYITAANVIVTSMDVGINVIIRDTQIKLINKKNTEIMNPGISKRTYSSGAKISLIR
jgi:hypothetical protein